jgi:hypothetical protein
MRGTRAPYRVAKAIRARQSLAEIVQASRTPYPLFGPAYRAGLRLDMSNNPEDRELFADPNDRNRIRSLNPALMYKRFAEEELRYERERAQLRKRRKRNK